MTPNPIEKWRALHACATEKRRASALPAARPCRSRRVGVAATVLLVAAWMSPAQAASDVVDLAIQDSRLSLRASSVPVDVVLHELAAQAGFELVVFGELSAERRSWTINNLPVDVAVKRIAQDYGLMLFYDPDEGATQSPRLSTVYVVGAVSAASETASGVSSPRSSAALEQDPGERQGRMQMIEQLQGQPDPQSVESLVFSLQYDQDAVVRKRAVTALEALGGETAILSLENGLSDEDASVRVAVVSALARLGGPEASRALGQIIMGDPDEQVRAAAVNGIARQRDDVARVFLQAAIDDPWPIVSDAARRHLAAFEGEVSDAPQEQAGQDEGGVAEKDSENPPVGQ